MERLTVDLIRIVEEGHDLRRLPARDRDPFTELRLQELGFVVLGALRAIPTADEDEDDDEEEEPGFDPEAPRAPLQLLRLERSEGTGQAVWRDAASRVFAGVELTDRGVWVTLHTLLDDGAVVRSVLAPPPPDDAPDDALTWRPPFDTVAAWLAGDRLATAFPMQEAAGLVQQTADRVGVEVLAQRHEALVAQAARAHGAAVEHAELEVAAAVERRLIHVFVARLEHRDTVRRASRWVHALLAALCLTAAVPTDDGWASLLLVAALLWLATGGLVAALTGGAAWRAAVWPALAVLMAARSGVPPAASVGILCLATAVRLVGELMDVAWRGRLGAWWAARQAEPVKVAADQLRWAYRA
jgi:hypothetical protein